MTSTQDLDALVVVSDRLSRALMAITDKDVSLATPCADWDLAALIDHVTGGNWFTSQVFAGLAAHQAMANTVDKFDSGSATLEQAVLSVDDQLVAFKQPGVLDRTWHHVAGDLTGRQMLCLRLHDLIVHTWDIEETMDAPAVVPVHLVDWGLAELASAESLTAEHFGLTPDPLAARTDRGTAYLSRFGRLSDGTSRA